MLFVNPTCILCTEYMGRSSGRSVAATIAAIVSSAIATSIACIKLNMFNTGDYRGDSRLVSLQAIGRRDYANEHQSQRNVWRGLCYYAIVDVTLFKLEMESDDNNVNVRLICKIS